MKITREEITAYVDENIASFHQRRLDNLLKLKLSSILKRRNPYLYRAKNILTAGELVQSLLDARLSSQEEAVFGEFLEGLAIHINNRVFAGHKSSSEGIDLEFEKDDTVYLVSIKSGPNWGNSNQIKRLRDNFRQAIRIRRQAGNINIIAVNGCCYGKQNLDAGDFVKLCGQKFWHFISGNENLYIDIIEPLGHKAKERNDEFHMKYGEVINRFTKAFMEEFCSPDGAVILWEKVVMLNSQARD